jgi:hypothetical protein
MTDPNMDFSRIIEAARSHYENLKADIENASNRIEHIRLTALTQEAHKLLTDLEFFEIGLVYSRVASISEEDVQRYRDLVDARQKLMSSDAEDLPLDLPEFKSPFTPPGSTH